MKTVEKVLVILYCVLLFLNIVICFCDGNITAGVAYTTAAMWFAIAINNRRRAEIYMECCEMIKEVARDLIVNVRNLLSNHEQPETPKDGENER